MDFFINAFLAMAMGGLVGLERERYGQTLVGVRSFAFTSLFGMLCTAVPQAEWLVLAGFIGMLTISALVYHVKSEKKGFGQGITTIIMLPLTFMFGVLVGSGLALEAGVTAIVVTFLLVEKKDVHKFAIKVTQQEMIDLIIFAIVTFIAFPLIPEQPVSIFGTPVNLRYIWEVVAVVTVISFMAHVLIKYTKHRGAEYAAFLGAMISSLATLSLFSNKVKDEKHMLAVSELVSAGTVVGDVLLLAVVAMPLLLEIYPALALMAAGFLAMYLWFSPRLRNEDLPPQQKALSLGFILKFAAVFLAVGLLVNYSPSSAESTYLTSFIGGLLSSTSVAASLGYLFLGKQVSATVAATGIVLALVASTISKTVITSSKFPHNMDLWSPPVVAVATGTAGLMLIGAIG